MSGARDGRKKGNMSQREALQAALDFIRTGVKRVPDSRFDASGHEWESSKLEVDPVKRDKAAKLITDALAAAPGVTFNTQKLVSDIIDFLDHWNSNSLVGLKEKLDEWLAAAQPGEVSAELLEPIIWDYMYDDMEGRWPEMVQVMETDPMWANGKHNGDCTRQAHTCQRCLVESNKKDADKLAERINAARSAQRKVST